ncbi:estradiol 17-beta-dehydrogenase 8-like isoform X2 [Crassostrea angulata]|uniref:estradiol 17-beta-dehydrogenase 8-like isoform X2 n=1 Tax=Magallana angulata TaxID=2784310 RepID=UPI0022B19CBC|nr:estradiol 17-beta-dehydrogenase 8-like isoform X2 [Crassostrea angulata]
MLSGRLAVVTGAGSGIGRAVCRVFASEGATVIGADMNEKGMEETLSMIKDTGDHQSYQCDVSSSASVNNLLDKIKEKYSSAPQVAVNSAGITRDRTMMKLTEEDFDKVVNVNLKGTWLLNKAVGKAMLTNKVQGSIVNISSLVGKTGNIGQTNYAASKAGVIGITKSMAKEMGKFNIRVNAVLPGFIETPMTETVPENLMQMTKLLIPLGRLGNPEEIANTCAFLASDKSSYITGATIEVTGGLFM